MRSKLDQLQAMSVLVADTGDLDAIRAYRPVDCTTNPSLVLKASRMPLSGRLVAAAIEWSRKRYRDDSERLRHAAIRLGVLVAREATALVPGRVSIEVDPRFSYDPEGTVSLARDLIDQFEALGVSRERILIKIAATWEGIQAARRLQSQGIDCNLTLIFSEVQAFAAADANAYLISPFVGRITDWHRSRLKAGESLIEDPGVNFVRAVYRSFKAQGRKTIVMGASFRSVAQVEALAGCDRLTIAPELLEQLVASNGALSRVLTPVADNPPVAASAVSEKSFRFALSQDAMANEKLSEGIRGFVADTEALERTLATTIASGKTERETAVDTGAISRVPG